MGLSTIPNAAAKDLGAMPSAGNTAAADKTQASSSGTDTFDNLLSDRMAQDAVRRHADAQSVADDADRRTGIAHKGATRTSTASSGQDAKSTDGNTPVPNITTSAASTADTATAKQLQPASTRDLDTITKQVAVDPTAQLAVQIEAAHQATQQAAVVQLSVALPAAPSTSNTDTDATSSAASKSPADSAAALAVVNAAASRAQGSTDPAAMAQAGPAGLPVAKDAKASTANAPTPSATALPDSSTLAQTMTRTRAATDNAPAAIRQLGSVSPGQGANADRDLPHRDLSPHGAPARPVATTVTDAISHASDGGNADNTDNAGTRSNTQGNGMQFQDVLSHATGDGGMTAPTFVVGGANASTAAGASIAPQQVHTLPTFGDVARPQNMANQLAFMQVHRQSSAELQLNPAELGGMHVKLEVDNGAINASFICQHQAVIELVQDAMPRLRDTMQRGGMQLAQASVSTDDFSQQQNTSQGSSAQNQGSGSGDGGSGSRHGSSGSQGRPDTVTAAPRRAFSYGGTIGTFA